MQYNAICSALQCSAMQSNIRHDNFRQLMLLLKVTEVTNENQKWPKVSQNSITIFFFARRAKKSLAEGRSPPQELEVKPAYRAVPSS